MKAPLPANETQRLEALRDYEVLDTPPEQAYDDLTLLAAQICQVPMAMVSLVDKNRQWFKSKLGVEEAETSRDIAFCAHTILHADEVLEVRDAQADPRFADSTLVTADPHVRFYAGAPLVTPSGHALGALCVMDRSPRQLTTEQLAALQALGRRVVAEMELRRHIRELGAKERETGRMLVLAEKSRRALLSVLEDEKLAAGNLSESEGRFRQVVENIREVFWMTDPTKNTMLYVSPVYEKIWGRTCASLLANPRAWLDAIHPDDRARVNDAATLKQVRGDYDETYRITRPDGSARWIRDRAFPIRDATGQVARIVGTAEDITERRALEDQFRQAQKMEAIGTLAGGIAHDFNNILGAIIGYTELAKLRLKDNPAAGGHLDAVLQGAQRAADLVRQILAFSRQQEQQLGVVQLRHLVAEPLKLLRATIPATIEFDVSFANNLPAVLADATQIHQVVMNLCTNAGHAMKDRPGRLGVRLENITADALLVEANPGLKLGPYVRLTVSDTGHGMDRATLARIFEPFFTTKGPGEGTGLGLSVVHGIMQSHHGIITVSSKPNEGTTFHLYFPPASGEAGPAVRPTTEIPVGRGERILFVDDEKPLALLGQKMLEELGYACVSKSNAADALAAIRADPGAFDLVITDLTMPSMTGVELAQQLRVICPRLPVILTTGHNAGLTLARLREYGIQELVLKPLSLQSLGATVHRVVAGPTSR
jgi:PAS domain S-box-containing protein